MYVYSGKCRLCNCGEKTDVPDHSGESLTTGDIVMVYTVNNFGVSNFDGLSVVVSDQWESYSDGKHVLKDGEPEYYVMGIKDVELEDDSPIFPDYSWRVCRLKRAEDVIDGEHWKDFGFRYSEV